jgi:hypothetical protein
MSRARPIALFALGCAAAVLARSEPGSTTYKGLELTVKSLSRSANVSLQDCPPGDNIVRGVIRPGEENEFATVAIEVKVLPSFAPVQLEKPLLYDETGKAYKTAQSFAELNAQPSYSCAFSFRVPKGTRAARFAIGEASFDLSSFTE